MIFPHIIVGSVALAGKYVREEFGRGVGAIVLSEVACIGNESTLGDCLYAPNHCSHKEDAGVRCRYKGTFLNMHKLTLV